MTDQELDELLVSTLKLVLEDTKECADYVKDLHTPEYEEIKEDYAYQIEDLEDILAQVKSLDDLAEFDEDTITAVYDYIACYTDYFIISNDPTQKEKDLIHHAKLQELLDLFLDDEEYTED